MSALSWPTAEAAWVAAVRAALGGSLALAIIWAHHRNPYVVDPPVVVLKIERFRGVDRGEALQFITEVEDPAFNEEIEQDTTRFFLCMMTVDIRVSTKDATGDGSPHALGTQLLTALLQESAQESLEAAGVGIVVDENDEATCPDEQINGVWVPTTKFPLRFYVAITATTKLGYIASYEGTVGATPPTPGAEPVPFAFDPEATIAAEDP